MTISAILLNSDPAVNTHGMWLSRERPMDGGIFADSVVFSYLMEAISHSHVI